MRQSLLAFIVFSLVISIGFSAYSQTPDEETVCDGFEGAAYGLCNAYCEAMDCDSKEPQASDTACEKVFANFMKRLTRCSIAY